MRKLQKRAAITAAVLFLAAAAAGILYLGRVARYKQAVKEISITEMEIARVSDGAYTGECDVGMVYAKVRVTVQDGEITAIDLLEHRNGRGAPAQSVLEEIKRQQRIGVETVAGATNSSKVLEKAVEAALRSGFDCSRRQ